MLTQNLGYPRIGGQRQKKRASENYWVRKISPVSYYYRRKTFG